MILHICPRSVWQDAVIKGQYRADTLETAGFIHCSEVSQIIDVANYVFKGKKDLVLLEIDPEKVVAEIKYEDAGNGELYPHIYGPLNADAVIGVTDFPSNEDGTFMLPNNF